MRRVYPYLASNLYAVYIGRQPRAKLVDIFTSKKEANEKKRELKKKHARSLQGAQLLHIVVIKYEQARRRFR